MHARPLPVRQLSSEPFRLVSGVLYNMEIGLLNGASHAVLSSRRPSNDGCHNIPSAVQVVNATFTTSRGSTQITPQRYSRGRATKGESGRTIWSGRTPVPWSTARPAGRDQLAGLSSSTDLAGLSSRTPLNAAWRRRL